ncbi:transcription factor ILR3-like isoform X1 [Tasmannia lanceolata]|uniref:transcription factor ILR3-like isoform X1 n=1 Tax=Tasmannia lanceolata TaxID=3420 RepID=UPI0040631C1E
MSDYDWINDVGGSDGEFRLILDCFNDLPNACVEIDDAFKDVHGFEQSCSRKRARDESLTGPKSKACREKMRRDRLNDRFIELGSVLELGRPPKSDKAMILSDAARVLVQLRSEARQLKEANEKLQETVKDLKVEKIELRDERTKLKADKQRLEHQVKAMSMPPAGFMPHITALHPAAATAISAHVQSSANKTAPFPGYPGLAMWQWMPPALVDTSQDHKLRPPVA